MSQKSFIYVLSKFVLWNREVKFFLPKSRKNNGYEFFSKRFLSVFKKVSDFYNYNNNHVYSLFKLIMTKFIILIGHLCSWPLVVFKLFNLFRCSLTQSAEVVFINIHFFLIIHRYRMDFIWERERENERERMRERKKKKMNVCVSLSHTHFYIYANTCTHIYRERNW